MREKLYTRSSVRGGYNFLTNKELYKLLKRIDVAQRINIQWLCWLFYIVRMELVVAARWGFELPVFRGQIG